MKPPNEIHQTVEAMQSSERTQTITQIIMERIGFKHKLLRLFARAKGDNERFHVWTENLVDDIAFHLGGKRASKEEIIMVAREYARKKRAAIAAKQEAKALGGGLNDGWPDNDGNMNDGFDAVDGPSFENEANLGDVFKRAESLRGLDKNGDPK